MSAQFLRQGNYSILSSASLSKKLSSESFEPELLHLHGQVESQAKGRGSAWFIRLGTDRAVLRHYFRGGLAAKVSKDRFIWAGVERTRAFAEYRLLEWMWQQGLPVPEPLGARVLRIGVHYSCDIITRTIANSRPLADWLSSERLSDDTWRSVGEVVSQMHLKGVWHADLNARNILIDAQGVVSLIDFDRCRRRQGESWCDANLARLRRSLDKLTASGEIKGFDDRCWSLLLLAYEGK